jgi:hypothetical protein
MEGPVKMRKLKKAAVCAILNFVANMRVIRYMAAIDANVPGTKVLNSKGAGSTVRVSHDWHRLISMSQKYL